MSEDTETADAAEMRRVLKLHGVEVKERGKLSADAHQRYAEILAGQLQPGDYPDGVTASDFDQGPTLDDIELDETAARLADELAADPGPPPGRQAEQTPRGSGQSAAERARSLWHRDRPARRRSSGSSARRRRSSARKHDWVPTGPVIERIWSELAWGANKLPPLQRVLIAQAPMTGVVMQEAVRDTFIDRWAMQPLARGEDRLEAANAVLGPPFWTTLIIRFGGFEVEQARGPQGELLFHDSQPVMKPVMADDGLPEWNDATRVMVGGLRTSLMSWIRIGQRHADEIIERAAELDTLSDEADQLIRFIFSPQRPGQTFRGMQAEVRDQTSRFMGTPAAPPPPAEPGSSAMAPEPARPGQASGAVPPIVPAGLGWPATAVPDPRTMSFVPPDPRIASQVVPRAPMPQG